MLVCGLLPVLGLIVVALIALLVPLPSSLLLLLLFRNLLPILIRPLLFLLSLSRLLKHVFWFLGLLWLPVCATSRIVVHSFVFGLIDIGVSQIIPIHPMIVMQTLDMLQVAGIADQASLGFLFTVVR
jgi:hypothetical protein